MNDKTTELNPGLRKFLESSKLAIAIYNFVDGKISTLLVSDGLLDLQESGTTREQLLKQYEMGRMYINVHPDDVVMVAQKSMEFALDDESEYDIIYRERLYGEDDYCTLHAVGYHCFLPDGERIAVILYSDISGALGNQLETINGFGRSITSVFENYGDDAFAIIDEKTHELLFCNNLLREIYKPANPFDSGITIEQYLSEDARPFEQPIDEIVRQGYAITLNPESGRDMFVSASGVSWNGNNAILLRITETSAKYIDPLTRLPNMEYYQERATNFLESGRFKYLVIADLYKYQQYFSSFGMKNGNQLLKAAVRILKEHFPDSIIFRYHGDVFLILSPEIDLEDATKTSDRQLRNFSLDGNVGISFGVCQCTESDEVLCKV